LYALAAPFTGDPVVLASLALRYAGMCAGNGRLALVWERWWKTRRECVWCVAPDEPDATPRLLFDRCYEDRYNDPGSPLTEWTPAGTRVLLTPDGGRTLFFAGAGACPEGDRPFLDRHDLETGQVERLWRSEPPYYERPVRLLSAERLELLTLREAVEEPPNYFVRSLLHGDIRPVTAFPHPTPQLLGVRKELVHYQREDGVPLTATLYLPPGYHPEQGPLPVLMWAYPREFKNADAAGQVRDSPYRFVRAAPLSALPFLLHGYAVFDGPAMPIIGVGDAEANDTYVEQLVANARAAVDAVVRLGVGDPERVAVGGHSYGGFMAANLLAHSNLFRAGIARSGAYNRTLTPFGFQAEERTLWEAPQVYMRMSPFMHAHQIKAPLLLIHGEADDNAGTFPMQSERLYNALKGHGATARLVILPHEGHGYLARESVMHTLYEMAAWLDRHVKHAPPREEPAHE
ncbi:MAG: prolyl oligopeptidase family serine peptidase, partial [Armatimonadota bacterium]|nr:prolyl oligopeptidase family serine peptidase [Armatimonadota bacterium]